MNLKSYLRRVSVSSAILSLAISASAPSVQADGPYCFGNAGMITICPCSNVGLVGNGCENSAGTGGGILSSSGVAGSTGITDTLALSAAGLPPFTIGLFFCGTTQAGGGLGVPFGDGLLCIGGTIRRLAVVPADGFGIATYDPSATNQTLIHVLAGTTNTDVRHHQFWYRDAGSYCTSSTFNLTNGLTITTGP